MCGIRFKFFTYIKVLTALKDFKHPLKDGNEKEVCWFVSSLEISNGDPYLGTQWAIKSVLLFSTENKFDSEI